MLRCLRFSFWFLLGFLGLIHLAFAEGSIYSLRGQGTLFYYAGGRAMAMGGATIAVANPVNLNWLNPAALPLVDQVRFSSQFLYQSMGISDGTNSYHTNYANFNGVFAVFPVHSNVGIGFGLQPVSKIDYLFESEDLNDNYQYTKTVQGLGGLNRIFFSTGVKLHSHLCLGGSFDFVFGKTDQNFRINYDNSDFMNTFDQFRSKYWGIHTGLGMIWTVVHGWNVGGVYQTSFTLNSKTDERYYRPQVTKSSRAKTQLPEQWGVGTSLQVKQSLLLALDYSYQDWQNYSAVGEATEESLTQFQRLSFGLEYGAPWQMNSTFFQRLRYRVGCAWEQPYYLDFTGNKLNSYFVTAGIGMPFASGNSAIDFAIEYGKNGKLPNNSFAEDILRLSVYICGGEKWFQR